VLPHARLNSAFSIPPFKDCKIVDFINRVVNLLRLLPIALRPPTVLDSKRRTVLSDILRTDHTDSWGVGMVSGGVTAQHRRLSAEKEVEPRELR
jgi:hypothetical protein